MPRPAAEGWAEGANATTIETAAFKLHEIVSNAGGTAGVVGVAVASPLCFSRLPWLVAVLVVFLAGLLVELGPGLLLEALHRRKEAAAKKREREEGPSATGEAAAAAAAAASSSPSSSVRQRRSARLRRLVDGERKQAEEDEQSPTAAGGRASVAGAAGRDQSLQGARVDVKGWRVVESKFASYKVVVTSKGGSWTVWRR